MTRDAGRHGNRYRHHGWALICCRHDGGLQWAYRTPRAAARIAGRDVHLTRRRPCALPIRRGAAVSVERPVGRAVRHVGLGSEGNIVKLHRPSLFAGLAVSLGAIVAAVAVASAASAVTWPWSPKPKPADTVMVTGSVSCSNVVSVDGYGGSPAHLTLAWGDTSKPLSYPFTLRSSKAGVIYRPPSFAGYSVKVTIPAGADSTRLSWHLQCRDQTGSLGSSSDGSFSVSRADMSRTICSYGSPLNPCIDPAAQAQLANCVGAVVTAGMDSEVLDLLDAVDAASKGWKELLKLAIGHADPVAGVVLGCTDRPKVTPVPPIAAGSTPGHPATSAPAPGGTGWTGSQAGPPAPSPPPAPHTVNAYDNYGPANAGHAMCRGNPGNGLSMPGGIASQTFTVPAGVAWLSNAMVQIDPDSSVTAHLALAVNGSVRATATATAAGDTRFSFAPVRVSPGQTVTLSTSFTASYGKIITVYTAGSPGGVFTAANSCPDGAPNVSTSATGLRAVVSGSS